jgi:hypothetical protein
VNINDIVGGVAGVVGGPAAGIGAAVLANRVASGITSLLTFPQAAYVLQVTVYGSPDASHADLMNAALLIGNARVNSILTNAVVGTAVSVKHDVMGTTMEVVFKLNLGPFAFFLNRIANPGQGLFNAFDPLASCFQPNVGIFSNFLRDRVSYTDAGGNITDIVTIDVAKNPNINPTQRFPVNTPLAIIAQALTPDSTIAAEAEDHFSPSDLDPSQA